MSIYIKRNLEDFISMRCKDPYCVCDKCAIHSLIDVLTEQQKEIEDQEGQTRELERRWADLLRRITKVEQKDLAEDSQPEEQPYTAMRSTGELSLCAYCMCMTKTINEYCGKCNAPKCVEPQEYCECKDRSISGGVCSICHKPIKPKEDVKKKLITYLTNHIGLNNNLDEIAGRILAIVKGE